MQKTRSRPLDRLKLRLVEASCATCIPLVRRQLEKLNGVEWVGANPILDLILVDYNSDLVDIDEILSAIRKSGYKAARVST